MPIAYREDRQAAEAILLGAAGRHCAAASELPVAALRAMRARYFVRDADVEPRVYWRLNDNWLELTGPLP